MSTFADPLLAARLGADRVIEPRGFLPQAADRLDPSGPVRAREIELGVEQLDLDATSFRNIREAAGGDPEKMAARVLEIVGQRGKMHNPQTGSGGVLLGSVSAVGESYANPPEIGTRIIPLMSLTLTPLRLEEIVALDADSPQIAVRGTAYSCEAAPWARLPEDLPADIAVEAYDVYAAASHTRAMAGKGDTVCVLGAGHAGRLACAAAKETIGDGLVLAVDIDAEAVEALERHGLCDVAVVADLRDPLAAVAAVRSVGAPPADLTIAVTNATGCEAAAILLTADHGAVMFFSMATSFSTAALTADGMASRVRMFVGSGYAPDRGDYAIELVRSCTPLRRALGLEE
jgi:L-erythro-3,5-diaminohexanoate dehydrogenase